MSLFTRALVTGQNSLPYRARSGEGLMANIDVVALADVAATLTVSQLSNGALRANFTVGRVLTTPTAASLLAAAPDMDIGDSFTVLVSMTGANAATWAAGAGVTILGRTTAPASALSVVVCARTGAATMSWTTL